LDINTGGIGEGSLSATAATSGRWSVVVRINGGSSDYSVTVNKTPAPDTDGDGVIDIVDAFPNDPDEIRDADADGIGDNADATPFGDNVALSSVNSALGKAASQSSQLSGNAASRAVDGITVGDNSQFTHTLREFQPWWQVRLDRSTDIGLIRLYNRTSCCSERLSNVHILVSNEDMSEFSLASLLENDNVSKAFISGPAGEIADIESIGTGRFIRIQLEATNYLSLAEVEVYEALLP
jgi:hypothetical protein